MNILKHFFISALILMLPTVIIAIPPVAQLKITNDSNMPIVQLSGSLQILNAREQFCLNSQDLNGSFKAPILPQASHVFTYNYGSSGICALQDKYETFILRIDSVNKQPFVDQIPCQISHELNAQGSTLHYAGSETILSYTAGKWTCTKL